MLGKLMRATLVGLAGLMIASCGGVGDDAATLNIVPPAGGKADGTTKMVSGYVLVMGVDTSLHSSGMAIPPQEGWVQLYSYFGSKLGQIDLSYYRRVGTVSYGQCNKQKLHDPFHNSAIGYDNFLCYLTAMRPYNSDEYKSGYLLLMIVDLDDKGKPTGHIDYPFMTVEGNVATSKKETPVFAEADPRSEQITMSGVGTKIRFSFDRLVPIEATRHSTGGRVRMLFIPVRFK